MRCVEVEVQFKNPHARLAEKSELSSYGVLLHKGPNLCFAHLSFPSDTLNLKLGRRRGDVRIEA